MPQLRTGAGVDGGSVEGSFDMVYDGYCDGNHLNIYYDGLVDGSQIGCTSGPLLGTRNRVWNQGHAISFTYGSTADYAGFFTVVRADNTWTIYANDGGGIYVINSGTWSYGAPPLGGKAAIE